MNHKAIALENNHATTVKLPKIEHHRSKLQTFNKNPDIVFDRYSKNDKLFLR